MKTKYELTVGGKSTTFVLKAGEDFDSALSRGAAKLGYKGGAFAQPNFGICHVVTVMDRATKGSNARQSYTGVCMAA